MNAVCAYHQILVEYLPYRVSESTMIARLITQIQQHDLNVNVDVTHDITLPVYYSEETALDLVRYQNKGIALKQLIELHAASVYTVSAIGFAPGFPFLSDVVEPLRLPRLTTPRLSVPAGSVAIADSKTAIYPSDSPAGWNVIGRCPITLFDPNHIPICALSVGDRVSFKPISRDDFIDLGGRL